MEKGKIQVPLSSLATINLRVQDPGYSGSISSNTEINHIMVSVTNHYNATFTDIFPLKTKVGKDSWYFNNSLLCKPEVSSTWRTFIFLLEIQKTTTLQQVAGGKTLNLVLKAMLQIFRKIFTFSRKSNFSTEKKTAKLIKKENFKPQIKSMIQNIQDEIYQLENKQKLSMPGKFLQRTWKLEYTKSNNIWVRSTGDINQNIPAVLKTFSNLQKHLWEFLYQGDKFQSCNYWISYQKF